MLLLVYIALINHFFLLSSFSSNYISESLTRPENEARVCTQLIKVWCDESFAIKGDYATCFSFQPAHTAHYVYFHSLVKVVIDL